MNKQDKQWKKTLESAPSKAFNEQAQTQALNDEKEGHVSVFDVQDLLAQIAQRAEQEKKKSKE